MNVAARDCQTLVANMRPTLKTPSRAPVQIERGEAFNLIQPVHHDVDVLVTVEAQDSVSLLGLATDGSLIEAVRDPSQYPTDTLSMSEILLRLADMVGDTADWGSDVTVH